MTARPTIIVSHDRNPAAQQREIERAIFAGLTEWPEVAVTAVPHLYDLTPDGPVVQLLRSLPGDLIVLSWLYPRATYWVLDANGVHGHMGRTRLAPDEEVDDGPSRGRSVELPDRTIWCLDLRATADAASYLAETARLAGLELPAAATTAGKLPRPAAAGPADVPEETTSRWYPVIDFDRCANCLECLNFCLFGVFGLDEADSIVVEQPDACRHGCPACSRICPAGAIMFPQHGDPAIAGDGAATATGSGPNLVQLSGGIDPRELAHRDQERAIDQHRRETRKKKDEGPQPGQPNELDRLVDEVDDLEL
jgi:NAD-dependent dihydropyrimidine dehydrogenase PreA subunit